LTDCPEVEIASLVASRHRYLPGSDLLSLIEEYADVEHRAIPVPNVDGVSLHLKVKGRRPSIIVNSQIAQTRQRFTLAHEFGHVLIPWHIGTIFSFSSTDGHTEGADQAYWEMEAEANRFAAELLMPQHWLKTLHEEQKNPAYTAKTAAKLCGTSMQAIIIALNNSLPPGYVYASLDATGHVLNSSCSKGTFASALKPGNYLDASPQLKESEQCFEYEHRGLRHNWMSYEAEQDFEPDVDTRPWREVLDKILMETGAEEQQSNIKMSLNAIVASSNRREYSANAFYAAVRQKLVGRGKPYEDILAHAKFNSYLIKRIEDLMSRRSN
jgi:Zn-dependent peptidase ImmA (M78 family)